MQAALQHLGLPRDADLVLGVARLDQQLALLLPVLGHQVGVEGDGGDDGGVDGVGRHLDGPRELDVETLGDGGGDHAGHGDGLRAGVEDEQLQGLGAGVRGHEAEVHHLLRAVDPGLRGHLHLQRQVEELSTGRVGLDPENIKCFINI